jgi:hypothetical protein
MRMTFQVYQNELTMKYGFCNEENYPETTGKCAQATFTTLETLEVGTNQMIEDMLGYSVFLAPFFGVCVVVICLPLDGVFLILCQN